MKVMLVNGSPHEKGSTFVALSEVAKTLNEAGVETEFFWIGTGGIPGCLGCRSCAKTGKCVYDDIVNECAARLEEFDGFVFGSPVHYAAAGGAITSFMDRLFYSASGKLRGKPGAVITVARRAGTTAALDQLIKYLTISEMPVVSSMYWNMAHGAVPEDVPQDLEGMQIMRTLGRNMAWLLKCIEVGKNAGIEMPEREPRAKTNFIR
ncbi:MAG: flavodoxin family protein [Oscillospiraceae bacterium]